jgi:hypothetical protein
MNGPEVNPIPLGSAFVLPSNLGATNSVTAFGAAGDGVKDDTEAILA